MTKNTMALFPTVCFLSLALGCGSNDPADLATACPPGQVPDVAMNCYTPPDPGTTGTATSTVTQPTATSTTTATGTNYGPVPISLPDGQVCYDRIDIREPVAGGIADLSGNWKVTIADGRELLLKAVVSMYDGQASACGVPVGVTSPKPTHWRGVSTEKCIVWMSYEDGTLGANAPWIQGTGIAADATGTTCIIGGNPNVKVCRTLLDVPGCP